MDDGTRIPVSWWLFFPDGYSARACVEELEQNDFLAYTEHRPDITWRDEKWLVRAARPFPAGGYREERRFVSDLVRSHGGVNEGSDSGWIFDMEQLARFQSETAL